MYWHYTRTLLGISLIQSGDEQEGRKLLKDVIRENERRLEEGVERPTRWDLAAAHAALGDAEQAFRWLERAYEAGFRHPRWIELDPAFRRFRDDPRYEKMLATLENDVDRMRRRLSQDDEEAP